MLVCDAMSCFTFCSNFSEIFDVNWFTSYLSNDVKIIKQLPSSKGRKALSAYNMRVPRKCNERCYINRILPILVKKRVSFLFHKCATGAYCAVQLMILRSAFIYQFDCYLLLGRYITVVGNFNSFYIKD